MTTPYTSRVLADKPIAYYRMDEASGQVVHDISGNGNHATLSGIVTLGQQGVFVNDADASMLFDGPTGVLSLPPSLLIGTWQVLTLEFWVRVPSTIWQYIVIVAHSTGVALYLQGQRYLSGVGSDTFLVSDGLDWVGSAANGSLDEVALYNALLSPDQVAAHFAAAPLSLVSPQPDQNPFFGGMVGATTLPLKQVQPLYAVGGLHLADQPYLATAPAPLPGTSLIPAGTPFTLTFQAPTAGTQTLLASGKSVLLTFLLTTGRTVTSTVQVTSTLSGSTFQVQCTLLASLPL